jgi:NCS1 family nucleobase:cation symporter-1
VFPAGVVAMVAAVAVAVMSANTTLYVGPISAALGGADLSAIVGPLLGGGLYALLWLTTGPYRDPAERPGAASAHPAAMIETDAAASAPTTQEVPA